MHYETAVLTFFYEFLNYAYYSIQYIDFWCFGIKMIKTAPIK